MLKIGVFLALVFSTVSLIKPIEFSAIIKDSLPQGVKIIPIDLGRSLHGYTIMAYAITAIPNMPDHPQPSALTAFPSSLMTSYLHPRDQHTIQLALLSVQVMLSKYSTDFYTRYMLLRGIVWVIPHVNIDPYENFIRNGVADQQQRCLYSKNWNKNPDPYDQINYKCSQDHTKGVNLDNNFWHQYSRRQDICQDFYGGFDLLSEPQAQVLQKFITTYNIRILIDLQAYGDYWVYPNHIHQQLLSITEGKITKANGNIMIYADIISKLRYGGYSIGNSDQIRTEILGGGFIEWASKVKSPKHVKSVIENRQGIIALTCMFGKSFILTNEQLQDSANKAIQVISMVIEKNNPRYEKYINSERDKIYIKGVGVVPFLLNAKIQNLKNQQTFQTNYEVKQGQTMEINLPKQKITNPSNSKSQANFQIHLKIVGTAIEEVVDLNSLKEYESAIIEMYENLKISPSQHMVLKSQDGEFVYRVCKFVAIFLLGMFLFRCKGEKKGYQQVGHKKI